jgi:ribosomal 50S subunit-recycling heat shock protein
MKKLLACAIAAAVISAPAFAKNPKSYQVTGTVTDVGDDTFTLQKKVGAKTENWEIAKGTAMNAASVKKGDNVTVQYQMTATQVNVKGAKEAPAAGKTAPTGKESSTKTETTTEKTTTTTAPAPGK